MSELPKVTAIVPIFNSMNITIKFLESLSRSNYANLAIAVVDDGSTDGSAEAIARLFPSVKILHGDGNLWWSGATDLGVADALKTDTHFVLVINNDNVVDPDFLGYLVETAAQHPKSIVTSAIYDNSDRGRLCSLGSEILWLRGELRCRTGGTGEESHPVTQADCLNGTSTLIPVEAFREIGMFDAKKCPQYHGDSDFALRAKAHGYRLLVDSRSKVYNLTDRSGGNSVLNDYSFRQLLTSFRSPFYFPANYKIYKNHCPYRPFVLFLAIRYVRLVYSVFRRTFIDRTRSRPLGGERGDAADLH